MKPELSEWLERGHPVHLSVLFTTDHLRRKCRFDFAAVTGLMVLDTPLPSISTPWTPHNLQVLITRLVEKAEFIVGEELQQVLDLGLYNAALNVLFSDLWEARFGYTEGGGAEKAVIDDLIQKSFPLVEGSTLASLPLSWVQHDIALFWMTLAKQNGILDRVVAFVPIDTTDDRDSLHHLHQFILSTERWAALGSPLRFLTALIESSGLFERLEGHPLLAKLQDSLV
jgi:hypothetical protein